MAALKRMDSLSLMVGAPFCAGLGQSIFGFVFRDSARPREKFSSNQFRIPSATQSSLRVPLLLLRDIQAFHSS
jgi:hypothetical protein